MYVHTCIPGTYIKVRVYVCALMSEMSRKKEQRRSIRWLSSSLFYRGYRVIGTAQKSWISNLRCKRCSTTTSQLESTKKKKKQDKRGYGCVWSYRSGLCAGKQGIREIKEKDMWKIRGFTYIVFRARWGRKPSSLPLFFGFNLHYWKLGKHDTLKKRGNKFESIMKCSGQS